MAIKKDTLHPEGEVGIDIYPKTSIDQVENLQANLDALNGDIANANGEISAVSNRVNANERNITDLQQDVDKNIMDIATAESNIQGLQGSVSTIAEKVDTAETGLVQLTEQVERVGNQTNENTSDISNLNTAYNSYNDYTIVTNGFLLTYLSGKQIELPIKAGTNVTFSKYPGSNQIIINSTGGSVPDNIALLDAANTFTAKNTFNETTCYNSNVFVQNAPLIIRDSVKKMSISLSYNGFSKNNENTGDVYSYTFPNKKGTMALVEDIPNTSSFATLAGNNKWTGDNIFDGFSKSIRVNGLFQVSGDEELISATYNQVSYDGFNIAYMDGENQNIFHVGIDFENKARFGFDKYDGSSYNLYIPEKDGTIALLSDIPSGTSQDFSLYSDYEIVDKGFMLTYVDGSKFELPIKAGTNVTFSKYPGSNQIVINATGRSVPDNIALTTDIPISLMYSSSKLGENSVDFPFNIDKNYFFTITMTNTGESKSFIYARGTSATYTIVINSSTSFEVKLDATGSSTRLIFTNKSNADPFVVRAEISN